MREGSTSTSRVAQEAGHLAAVDAAEEVYPIVDAQCFGLGLKVSPSRAFASNAQLPVAVETGSCGQQKVDTLFRQQPAGIAKHKWSRWARYVYRRKEGRIDAKLGDHGNLTPVALAAQDIAGLAAPGQRDRRKDIALPLKPAKGRRVSPVDVLPA